MQPSYKSSPKKRVRLAGRGEEPREELLSISSSYLPPCLFPRALYSLISQRFVWRLVPCARNRGTSLRAQAGLGGFFPFQKQLFDRARGAWALSERSFVVGDEAAVRASASFYTLSYPAMQPSIQ
jgi:hypothetical protein